MFFFFNIFKKLLNKPSIKFKLNILPFKLSNSLNFNHLIYIHLFLNITKQLKIKIFKTNLSTINYLLIKNLIILNMLVILWYFI